MDIIRSIRVFQEVVKQQSFKTAAEQLNMVPSAGILLRSHNARSLISSSNN